MNRKLNNKQLLLYHMPIVLLLFLIKENLLHLIRPIAKSKNSTLMAVYDFESINKEIRKHPEHVLYITKSLRRIHKLSWHIKRANKLNETEFYWLKANFLNFYTLYYKKYNTK